MGEVDRMTLPPLPSFAEVIEQAPDAIVLVDASGAIVYANQRIGALFALAPGDLLGRPIEVLIPQHLHTSHAAYRRSYAEAPKIRPMGDSRLALAGRRADGTEFPVDIHLAPIESDGRGWTLAVIRDATERHRFLDELRGARQAAEQIARLKGEFLALAAHDLSQPHQTLELLLSMIERRVPQGSEVAEFAQDATASLQRMRELLKMLIEVSSLESATLQVATQSVSVAEIFSDLERQFAPVARAKTLRFASEPCSHVVETDPALLRGMLSNLVSNAIRYTPRGGVSVRCVAPADGTLRLAIADTGIGIPGDQLQNIFQDFHRLDPGRQAHRDGFGLGLGIVRRLSVLLDFPVSVQSTVGGGSTFNIEIPARKVFHAA
jgi:PAS domain S-box-containing protein